MNLTLPAFPPSPPPLVAATSPLHACGVTLRCADAGDLAFLCALYHQSRQAELAAVPWPDATRRAFLDSQFALQHRHYVSHYLHPEFLIVVRDGAALGRLYLQTENDALCIVDILLLEAARGQGVGTALLGHVRHLAQLRGCQGVQLSVLRDNTAAQRLYQRLGFTRTGADDSRIGMRLALS
ncbi:GNAT family N-acetyltransferase [Bacillus subtilis subsp. subtilis]|nr:GNAT family N-acetyltransferase [Bacillus subtilis subsp. subtilis]